VGAPTAVPAASAHRLPNVVHTWQKWNNCGPSAAMMALSAFGIQADQLAIAAQLKPDREDTNVSPDEIAWYLRRAGLGALVRPNGDSALAKALIAAGVPVIAEQWIDVDGRGQMGHYRVLVGYDDATAEVIAMDSYYGPSLRLPYAVLDAEWRPFSGKYIAVFADHQAEAVRRILGPDHDEAVAWQVALLRAEARTRAAPSDPWSWFALGEARSELGDSAGAVEAHRRAQSIGLPFRAYWYQFGFAGALYEAGLHRELVEHADATLETMGRENLEEWHTWRALALAAIGMPDEARAGLRRALEFNPNHQPARSALDELEALLNAGPKAAGADGHSP